MLRPLLLGMEWRGGKTAFLTGPFYYYALVLFALLGLAMWRITQSPFGLHLKAIRENAGKAAYVGVQILSHAARRLCDLGGLWRHRRHHSGRSHRPGRS